MNPDEWYATREIMALGGVTRAGLRVTMYRLLTEGKIFRVRLPETGELVWHLRTEKTGIVPRKCNEREYSRGPFDFKECELPPHLRQSYVAKAQQLRLRPSPIHEGDAVEEVVDQLLDSLDLHVRKARPSDGFPYLCCWDSRPRTTSEPKKSGAYTCKIEFSAYLPLPHKSNERECSFVLHELAAHIWSWGKVLLLDMIPLSVQIDACTRQLLSSPSRDQIIEATKIALRKCKSRAPNLLTRFTDEPPIDLFPLPKGASPTKAYTFRVQPRWIAGAGTRHITLLGAEPFSELHELIIEAFEEAFESSDTLSEITQLTDDSHLHVFEVSRSLQYADSRHYEATGGENCLDDEKHSVSSIPIQIGKPFKYIFDFGANVEFQITLLKIEEPQGKLPIIIDTSRKRKRPTDHEDEDEGQPGIAE